MFAKVFSFTLLMTIKLHAKMRSSACSWPSPGTGAGKTTGLQECLGLSQDTRIHMPVQRVLLGARLGTCERPRYAQTVDEWCRLRPAHGKCDENSPH